jgi:hypothetical protein
MYFAVKAYNKASQMYVFSAPAGKRYEFNEDYECAN